MKKIFFFSLKNVVVLTNIMNFKRIFQITMKPMFVQKVHHHQLNHKNLQMMEMMVRKAPYIVEMLKGSNKLHELVQQTCVIL